MSRISRIVVAVLVGGGVLAPMPLAVPGEPATREPGPRKVVVGTLMYNMFHTYPGVERRLAELGAFIDQMAERAQVQHPGRQLDIAALPEMAVNGNAKGTAAEVSLPLEGPVLEAMSAKARQHQCYIAVPLYLVDDRRSGSYSNAVVLLDRRGKVVGTYRKVYPVAGRGQEVLEGGVAPGREFPVFECDFGRVGFQICFDILFDDGWEALGRKGAELVIWPTQSPGQIKPAFRAMRNGYYVLSSTWRDNASLLDPTGHRIREITGSDGVFVEEIDLDYVLLTWQPELRDGRAFTDKYGDRVGYRYSRAEDSGIFWSNDPDKPIREMVRELDLELPADLLRRNRLLHARYRQGPVERVEDRPVDGVEDVAWLAEVTQAPPEIGAERVGKIEPLLTTAAGQPVRTLADWEQRRGEIRDAWLKFLGPMPQPRPPVKLETLRVDQADGFTRQLVRYEGEPGLFDEAYILRPADSNLERNGRLPGLVALHQTAPTSIDEVAGISGSPMQHLGPQLARRGFVVICPRNFLWKTTSGFDVRETVRAHRERHPHTLGMHKMLYDATRAVDVLASLEGVDPQRLGAVGHSLGGKEVLYLLPFDPRLKAGVASEGGLLFRSTNWRDPWYLGSAIDDEQFPLNHHQLLALAAPRPLLILAGEKGSGAADGDRSWSLIGPAQQAYALYGQPVRLGQYNHGQGHSIPAQAYARLEQWLVRYVAE